MQPMLRRNCGTFHELSREMSLPATMIRPAVGASSLSSRRSAVDFPDPEGPTMKTNSPLLTLRLTSRNATTSPL
jgi:hypothetical protein